jgi:hypothetical protein
MRWIAPVVAFVAGFAVASLIWRLTPLPWGLEFFYLLVAGGFGGLAQALITSGNRLRPPGWTTDGERPTWEAGFLADVFIGMLGATVSLMFALALSDRFFGVVGDSDSAWVRIVAFGALTGFASRQLLPNLSKRLSDMITQEVDEKTRAVGQKIEQTVGRKIEQTIGPQVELARTQAEIAQLEVAAVSPPSPATTTAAMARGADGFARLKDLVERYGNIRDPDEQARVAARMEIADAMLPLMVQEGVTSELLAQRIESDEAKEKEYVLALATLIAARPGPGDAKRLLDAVDHLLNTPKVKGDSKFILYRVLLAIAALKEKRRLPVTELGRAKALAEECRRIDDAPLQRKAEAVLALLG